LNFTMNSFWSIVVMTLAATLASTSAFTASYNSPVRSTTAWVRAPKSLTILKSEEPAAAEEAPAAAAPAAAELSIDDLVVDAKYEGTVKGVSDYGAFVDIGCSNGDGLVHKSQLADSFVSNPADIVSVGDKVNVRILSVDLEKGQFSLSMKSPGSAERKPRGGGGRGARDMSKYENMGPEETLEATVQTLTAYGCFVNFEDGVSGLVHISQLSEGRVESVEEAVSAGDKVTVRVLGVESGKLNLTMKKYDPDAKPERRQKRDRDDDGDSNPRTRKPFIEDIYSDTTEPKWLDVQGELAGKYAGEFDNILELKV